MNPYHLTKDQEEVVKALQERVSVSVDKKTLVITASVQMQDPVISAQMTKVVLENLQNYITNYRTQKVKQDLEFTQKVFGESRDAYYKAQRAYAAFEDANRNIISSSYRTVAGSITVYTGVSSCTRNLSCSNFCANVL